MYLVSVNLHILPPSLFCCNKRESKKGLAWTFAVTCRDGMELDEAEMDEAEMLAADALPAAEVADLPAAGKPFGWHS